MVIEKIKKYLELKNKIKLLEKEAENIKVQIKIYMKENNLNNYKDENNQYFVNLKEYKRESIDKKKLLSIAGENIYNECLKKSSYEVIKIADKEEKERVKKFMEGK